MTRFLDLDLMEGGRVALQVSRIQSIEEVAATYEVSEHCVVSMTSGDCTFYVKHKYDRLIDAIKSMNEGYV